MNDAWLLIVISRNLMMKKETYRQTLQNYDGTPETYKNSHSSGHILVITLSGYWNNKT